MKHVIVTAALAVALVGCNADTPARVVSVDSLQNRNNVMYMPNETDTFTGRAVTKWPNGQIKESVWITDGHLDMKKVAEEFYENGMLDTRTTYRDGGIVEELFREDGSQRWVREKYFVDGKMEKNSKRWREDGTLWETQDRAGNYKVRYKNGQVRSEGVVLPTGTEGCDGAFCQSGTWTYYKEDGTVKEIREYDHGKTLEEIRAEEETRIEKQRAEEEKQRPDKVYGALWLEFRKGHYSDYDANARLSKHCETLTEDEKTACRKYVVSHKDVQKIKEVVSSEQ